VIYELIFWVDGAGIVGFSDGTAVGWSVPLGPVSIQQAELLAVKEALLRVRDRWSSRVTIHSDSAYAVGVLVGTTRAKANRCIIEDTQKLIADCRAFRMEKCNGHTGLLWNEHADRLAKQAARTQKRSIEALDER
jgi:ribonuclease HI